MSETRYRVGVALCVPAGALHALAFAPSNFWWLELVALAALFVLIAVAAAPAPRTTLARRRAALYGFAFGLGWFGVGVWWVYISMHVYGQMPAVLAALGTLALAAGLALLPAAGCALGAWLVRPRADVASGAARSRSLARSLASSLAPTAARAIESAYARRVLLLVALPAGWTFAECVRGVLFTGFPWLATGYAHSDGPLAGFGPVIGVYGMSLVAALIAGSAALALIGATEAVRGNGGRARAGKPGATPWRDVAIAATGAVVLPLAGLALTTVEWTRAEGAPIRVRLIQGNIPQDLKFSEKGMQRAAETHARLLRGKDGERVDLTVLPESVYPVPLNYLPDEVTRTLIESTRTHTRALVFGVFIEDPPGKFYNSAIALGGDAPQRYSKRHLVPFGEYVPTGFRWFVNLMQMPIGDQERGPRYQPPFELVGQRIAANICYEDLFGAEIIDAWRDRTRAPTLLLNLSNLAWFNDSRALPQHLQISRLRSIETGRPMLRATNTGATAVIDARGRVVSVLPFNTEATLVAAVQGHAGTTPFVRFGNWPALLLVVALLAIARIAARR